MQASSVYGGMTVRAVNPSEERGLLKKNNKKKFLSSMECKIFHEEQASSRKQAFSLEAFRGIS